MNRIWVFLVIFCIVYGIINGNAEELFTAILEVPYKTLELLLKIGGLIIFYNGLLQIAIKSGLINKLSIKFQKPINKLFPKLPQNSPAREHICLALITNLLGLGMAGAPSIIKALQIMKKENQNKEEASPEMIKFILLNIAAFTIFPITSLSIRKLFFSEINLQLLPYFSLCSLVLTVFALLILKLVVKKNVS
ncbi:MAG: hypothetical protein PHX62_02245 [Bacilli bacterium]|nr:hypothetical protein [Bacilli bacterium]